MVGSDMGGDGRDARLGFTARSDGEVFVEASGDRAGTYRLSVIEVAGDQPDNTDTPATLAAGGIAHGTIDWAGEAPDRDWYRLELTAGHSYRIDLEGRSSGAGSLFNPQLLLVDAGGNPVPASGDYAVGWNDSSIVRASADTAIFAAISGFGSSGDRADTGTYRLSVTELDDPVGQDVEAAADLPTGVPMDGAIEFEDHDWFRIDAEAGVTYLVTLANVRLDGVYDAFALSLRNASGETFSQSGYTEDGADVELGFTAKADGDLFVDVLGNGTGTYRLEVAPFIGEVPDNELTQARLAVGSPVAGTIDWAEGARDTDWYRVEVVAGRTYVATMEGAASGAGTLPAPYLNLATAAGDWRDSVQSDGTATLSFTAARDDTVFVVASGYGEDEEGFYSPFVGSYHLTLREIANDIADDIHTAATLSVGQVVDGTFDFAEDRDWYRVEVVAGRTYVFDITGTASGEGTGGDAYLILYNSDGDYLRETSGGEQPGSRLGWTADADGAVYIATRSLVPGGYRLGLSELTGDVPGSVDGAATLEPGRATDGVVDYDGDEDLYRFDALAGHTYRVLLAGSDSAAGTLASPRLWLVDSEGGWRSGSPASDDSADRVLGITADADGPVVIGAGGADAGTYSLSVEDLTTDILASPATTQTLAVGAKIDGIIDIADDRDWYRIEVIAGRTYYVELTGLNQDTTAVETALLTVRDSTVTHWLGPRIFRGEGHKACGFPAPVDGELYIEIADKRSWDYETASRAIALGPYRVGLQELLEEAGRDPEKASSLVADTRVGVINSMEGRQRLVPHRSRRR
ncbi:MAG: hypothetical protein U1E14_14550 [Geminicoccaceae bacterium]